MELDDATRVLIQRVLIQRWREEEQIWKDTEAALLKENRELRKAAQVLVDKMNEVIQDERYQEVFTLAWTIGRGYTGPTFYVELSALEEALRATSDV